MPAGGVSPQRAAGCKSPVHGNAPPATARSGSTLGFRLVTDFGRQHVHPRTLAGATVLQIVPALSRTPLAQTAVDVAYALLQAGARALVAAAGGPLVEQLQQFGGEWIEIDTRRSNPLSIRRNRRLLEDLIAIERIDIVHAHGGAAAWSAREATEHMAVWLVTTLPDVPSQVSGRRGYFRRALTHGDRVIAPSSYAAAPLLEHGQTPRERLVVIPHSIDTARYDPTAVHPERITALLQAWRIAPGERVIVTPGRVAPWNGQLMLIEAIAALADNGVQGMALVLVGETRSHRRYARAVAKHAQAFEVEGMVRMVGHCNDMPAALAAADVVAVAANEPPVFGRVVAQAQAMARPVVTTNVGVLPEYVVTPPYLPEELRTGWVVRPDDPAEFAGALAAALALDDPGYRALGARARQFAEYMFSPQAEAEAIRAVYTSLLERDA